MPSKDQHRQKAARNRAFLDTISIDDYPDWVVVAAFYTAIHLVEELRAAKNEGHSKNHDERLEYVQHQHPEVHSAYFILKNASMLARYESNSAFFAQFDRDLIQVRLVGQYLRQIEAYVHDAIRA